MTDDEKESRDDENSTETVEIVFTATARTVGELKERQSALQPMRRMTQYFRLICVGLGGLLILGSPLLLLFDFGKDEMAVTFVYGVVTFGIGFALHNRFQDVEQELRDLEFEIELAGYDISEREIRAERMFRRNEYELLKYYHLNLRQNRWMLLIGLACIAAGLIVVFGTLGVVLGAFDETFGVKVIGDNTVQIWIKSIVAVVGAVGAIMVNVVAAIYLQLHKSASDALGEFHKRLVKTNQLFLSNVLASRVGDAKRDDLLSELAKGIVQAN